MDQNQPNLFFQKNLLDPALQQQITEAAKRIVARRIAESKHPTIDNGSRGTMCKCWYTRHPWQAPDNNCQYCHGAEYRLIEPIVPDPQYL